MQGRALVRFAAPASGRRSAPEAGDRLRTGCKTSGGRFAPRAAASTWAGAEGRPRNVGTCYVAVQPIRLKRSEADATSQCCPLQALQGLRRPWGGEKNRKRRSRSATWLMQKRVLSFPHHSQMVTTRSVVAAWGVKQEETRIRTQTKRASTFSALGSRRRENWTDTHGTVHTWNAASGICERSRMYRHVPRAPFECLNSCVRARQTRFTNNAFQVSETPRTSQSAGTCATLMPTRSQFPSEKSSITAKRQLLG